MKKRLLFVEDNPVLLEVYALMLRSEHARWEVSTAADGEQALALLDQSAFDVVISDMRMPGISGIELMTRVRQSFPRCSRIILSGLDDQEEVARCLNSTHQFLAKPFDLKALKATLNRIGGLDAYLKDEKLRALVGRLGSLPSFPSLYLEVVKELSAEEPSLERIAEIISKDPSMTVKMLQIVNSAAVGLARRITKPLEAVEMLGTGVVRSLVLSAHIFSCFERPAADGFSVDSLWSHLLRCAAIARAIMQLEQAPVDEAENAYIAAMLHDIGKLMLADSFAEQFGQALRLAAEKGITLSEAEVQVFGATHAGAAAYLLGLWGFPASIVEAVAFHHAPAQSGHLEFGPLAAVHAANVLEHKLAEQNSAGIPTSLDLSYLEQLGLDARLPVWERVAERYVES